MAWSISSLILAVGLTLLVGLVGKSIWEAIEMRKAVPVEGRLLSVELGAVGSTRSYTNARYQYDYEGSSHQSDRLALFKQTGSFYGPLKEALDQNRPIRVWVDPNNPQRAFLDREFVLWPFAAGLIFSLGWTAMGIHLMKRVWRASRKDMPVTIRRRPNKIRR